MDKGKFILIKLLFSGSQAVYLEIWLFETVSSPIVKKTIYEKLYAILQTFYFDVGESGLDRNQVRLHWLRGSTLDREGGNYGTEGKTP